MSTHPEAAPVVASAFRARNGEPLGSLARIWRFPTKALAAEELTECRVAVDGLDGDRVVALRVLDGHARVGKTFRGKEERTLHTLGEPHDAVALAAERGVTLAVDRDARYFDAETVSVLFDTWIADVARLAGKPIDPLRFRANLYVAADPAFTGDEAALIGRTLRIGDVALRVLSAIERCVTPSYDIATAAADPAIHRAYAVARGNHVGIYCAVVTPGVVRTGDAVSGWRARTEP